MKSVTQSWNKQKILIVFLIFTNVFTFCYFSRLKNEIENLTEEILSNNYQEQLELTNCTKNHKKWEPSLIYEENRRKIRSTLQYMWESVKFKSQKIRENLFNNSRVVDDLLNSLYEHKISMLSDWQQMTLNDGYETWRETESKYLSRLLQARFAFLQNPESCESARIFRSTVGWQCGWGCQFLQYVDKFSMAYGTQRTLLYIKPRNHFYDKDEWTKFYEPTYPKECENIWLTMKGDPWPGTDSSQVIDAPICVRDSEPPGKFITLAVPGDLLPRMQKVFEDPVAWWMGQIAEFLIRLKSETEEMIKDMMDQLEFQGPIVGVAVRRGNKITEIPYQPLSRYMEYVKEFYDILELTDEVDARRVYISTDDKNVIDEARSNYGDYEIITNDDIVSKAKEYQSTNQSVEGIIIQSQLMANCDFLVLTLSSNLGRRFYEFFSANQRDAKGRMKSLDCRHHEYPLQSANHYRVTIPHSPMNSTDQEIAALVGDNVIPLDYHEQNGVIKVMNQRSGQQGFLPIFKLQEIVKTLDFPIYDNVKVSEST